jgi:NAD(P)-dependent dehydrogenase (short-subunit alcohol dehydrogenase family)
MIGVAGVLHRRCAIVSGGSRGLGLEIARRYLEAGASVAICARGEGALETALRSLEPLAAAGQCVMAFPADISKPAEVERFVDAVLERFGRLDILVNNAGVIGPLGASESVDLSGWIRALEVNLVGAVLMCRAVLPHIKKAKRGKIIQLSGGGATQPLPRLSAYATSKAAVVRFIETLAAETREDGVDINALSPGPLDTAMLDEMLAAGPAAIGAAFHARLMREKQSGATPLITGARLAVFLGSTSSDGITGKLISATWDPWPSLPQWIAQLTSSDVYTLRRILPKDRGMTWGEPA